MEPSTPAAGAVSVHPRCFPLFDLSRSAASPSRSAYRPRWAAAVARLWSRSVGMHTTGRVWQSRGRVAALHSPSSIPSPPTAASLYVPCASAPAAHIRSACISASTLAGELQPLRGVAEGLGTPGSQACYLSRCVYSLRAAVLGDATYGDPTWNRRLRRSAPRPLLHAYELRVPHPSATAAGEEVCAPLPRPLPRPLPPGRSPLPPTAFESWWFATGDV